MRAHVLARFSCFNKFAGVLHDAATVVVLCCSLRFGGLLLFPALILVLLVLLVLLRQQCGDGLIAAPALAAVVLGDAS